MKGSEYLGFLNPELTRNGLNVPETNELFPLLQRSYTALQFDLPFFMARESLAINKDSIEYPLAHKPIKNVDCKSDLSVYNYVDEENFYIDDRTGEYSFSGSTLLIHTEWTDETIKLTYRYAKSLVDLESEIDLPETHAEALRLLFMAKLYESDIRRTLKEDSGNTTGSETKTATLSPAGSETEGNTSTQADSNTNTSSTDYQLMGTHYMKLYLAEVNKIRLASKLRTKNVTTTYQRV